MKIELKIHGDDGSILEIVGEDVSVQVEADVVEVSPVNGYRCYERLPTSKITIQGEVADANPLSKEG